MSIGPWDFNGFDIAVLLVLITSLLMAASRGFIREVISILALIVSIVIALIVFGQFGMAARDFISPSWLANWILGAGTFIFSYMIIVFMFSGISKQLKGRDVGFFDRVLGAGFGVVRGLLIAALATLVIVETMGATDPSPDSQNGDPAKLPPDLLQQSTFYPMLDRIGDGIRALPFAKMKKTAEQLKEGDIDGAVDEISTKPDSEDDAEGPF